MTNKTPVINNPWKAQELLEDALRAFNELPNRSLRGLKGLEKRGTTYDLATKIGRFLRGDNDD